MLISEDALLVLNISMAIIGGFSGSGFLRPTNRLRRVKFLWAFIIMLLISFICECIALIFSQLIFKSTYSIDYHGIALSLMIFDAGLAFLFGVAVYYVAARRSMDIQGNRDIAWLAFVPIAHLWLFFKGANKGQKEMPPRSKASRWVFDPLMVAGAVMAFGFVQTLNNTLEEQIISNFEESASFRTQK